MYDIPFDSSRRAEYEYAKIFCRKRLEKKLQYDDIANIAKVKGPPFGSEIFEKIFFGKITSYPNPNLNPTLAQALEPMPALT